MTFKYRYRKRDGWIGIVLVIVSLSLTVAQQQGWLGDAQQAAVANQPGLYQVVQFVDGDTVVVDMQGRRERVRMIGVDTPETHKPNAPVQCYGPAASAYTKRLIGDQRIRLVSDSQSTNRDRYDRLLRYVYLTDGTNVNQQLINEGYGFYYPYFPFTQSASFEAAQLKAQLQSKGLWRACQPTQTDRGGYVSNPQM